MLPNRGCSIFYIFIFSFIDLFILEATTAEIIWYDQKACGEASAPAVLIIVVKEVFWIAFVLGSGVIKGSGLAVHSRRYSI